MPSCCSCACASASAIFTLPQPMGFVGGVRMLVVVVVVVVVVAVVAAPGFMVVVAAGCASVIAVPLRRPFTSASAFDCDPARFVKLAAMREATGACARLAPVLSSTF